MKKVLFVIHSLGFGGAERSLLNLLHELPKEKYKIDLLLFQNKGAFLQQIPAWVRVLDTPASLACLYSDIKGAGKYAAVKLIGTGMAKILRKTRKEQRAFRWKYFYRKVIEKNLSHYDVAAAYVGTEIMYFVRDIIEADKKLVWIHNDYRTASYSKKDDMDYLRDMDAIVSVSEECVNVLKEEFPQYKDRVYYIQNITSSSAVRRQADEFEPEEFEQDNCNILSVGRLSVQKGFDLAIEAAAILKQRGVRFRWFVIGDGDQRETLKEKIKAMSVEDCFCLLGTRNNPYPYIKHCSLFAQTSRFEGKSVVLDEAKILGVPILATAYPTAADQILDGMEGLITELTPQAIAEGIILMQDQMRRTKYRAYLMEHEYGNRFEVEKYMQLLDD